MARPKRDEAMTPEDLRREMTRGIRTRQALQFFDACGKKLEARGPWDILSMRDIREACLLLESITELRTGCAAKLKAGDYLTIWCTGEENKTPGKGDTFYADFKISSSGETLRLTDRDEEEIQKLTDKAIKEVDAIYAKKEKEIMEV